jgi:hypothetical protein
VNARSVASLIATASLVLAVTGTFAQQRLYRWVDNDGVVHYGDHIPPEFANRDRTVLNDQAVTVGFEEGEITKEERAELERRQAEADAEQLARDNAARRDRMLLETYLTVADIEDLRDRRLELLGSQIKVTELYLTNLRKRLVALEGEAQDYAPENEAEGAPALPENLALEISRVVASITLYEQTLERTRREQEALRAAFDLDIVRFRELKGG